MHSFLFLDFDGVLHPGFRGTFDRLPIFERWLMEHPHVLVVISSSWRLESGLRQLRDCFATPELHQRIIDVTPDLTDSGPHCRQREIERWLATNSNSRVRFAALDDDADLFRPGCPWLVRTDPKEALTPYHLAELTRLIG